MATQYIDLFELTTSILYTDSGVSMTEPGFAALPAVANPDIIKLVINPDRYQAEDPEIAYITAHTGGSSTVTILRGQEGTTGTEWPSGTRVAIAVTAADYEDFRDRIVVVEAAVAGILEDVVEVNAELDAIDAKLLVSSDFENQTNTGAGTGDDTYAGFGSSAWGSQNTVTVSAVTGTTALVMYGLEYSTGSASAGVRATYSVGGATTIAAGTPRSIAGGPTGSVMPHTLSRTHYETGLTPGTNTFTLLALSTDISVTTVFRPWIHVIPL